MSMKRILGIALFGVLFIVAIVGIMLLNLFVKRESDTIALPDATSSAETPAVVEQDALDRVEVTVETIQAVVSTLSRPSAYKREVVIKSFWESDQAEYIISVSVMGGMTSLKTMSPAGVEKRIIVTPTTLYIWYKDDKTPYIGDLGTIGDGYRTADEWQMLVTYEDVLALNKKDIIEAGYVEYSGEDCIYAFYRSPLLDYTRKFYISRELGLIIYAEEFDETDKLVYSMTTGECIIDEVDPAAFILPDGTDLMLNA